MSKNIETYSIHAERREDLMSCYREVAPTCLYQETAWKRTILHPAKKFYVTPKQAFQKISSYLKGNHDEIDMMANPIRKQLYLDLLEVVLDLSKKKENINKSLYCLVKMAVEQPAPRFYITTGSMRNIFSDFVAGLYDADGRSIRHLRKVSLANNMKNI